MVRAVFMGTPDFAVPSLTALIEHSAFEVVGVVTQPDRPAGRGRELSAPPVKRVAEEAGILVYQPKTLRTSEAAEQLQVWDPQVIVVAAFGQILRANVLDLPKFGCINVHASLLPRWRGAAPIQYAVRAGDSETGITIMRMDAGLDTGPMISMRAIPIAPDETGASLHDKLSILGAEMLPDALLKYIAGELEPQPQPAEGVTLAPTMEKSAGQINWSDSSDSIDRQVRAYTPWPGTFTHLDGEMVKIISGKPLKDDPGYPLPGTVVQWQNGFAVQTGSGLYFVEVVQPAGKKAMPSAAFLAGHPDVVGRVLGGE